MVTEFSGLETGSSPVSWVCSVVWIPCHMWSASSHIYSGSGRGRVWGNLLEKFSLKTLSLTSWALSESKRQLRKCQAYCFSIFLPQENRVSWGCSCSPLFLGLPTTSPLAGPHILLLTTFSFSGPLLCNSLWARVLGLLLSNFFFFSEQFSQYKLHPPLLFSP